MDVPADVSSGILLLQEQPERKKLLSEMRQAEYSREWFSFDDAHRNIDPKILAGIFLNAYPDDVQ